MSARARAWIALICVVPLSGAAASASEDCAQCGTLSRVQATPKSCDLDALRAALKAQEADLGVTKSVAEAQRYAGKLDAIRECARERSVESGVSCQMVESVFQWKEPVAGETGVFFSHQLYALDVDGKCVVQPDNEVTELKKGNVALAQYNAKSDTWTLLVDRKCQTSVGKVRQQIVTTGSKRGHSGVIISNDPGLLDMDFRMSQFPGREVRVGDGSQDLHLRFHDGTARFEWANGAFLDLSLDQKVVTDSNFLSSRSFDSSCRVREDGGAIHPRAGQRARKFLPDVQVTGSLARLGRLLF